MGRWRRLDPITPKETDPEFPGDRGFAEWKPTSTTYGAEVQIRESSAAEAPHLWLEIEQPPPKHGGDLEEARAIAHMNLDQAEEIHRKLGVAIRYMKEHG